MFPTWCHACCATHANRKYWPSSCSLLLASVANEHVDGHRLPALLSPMVPFCSLGRSSGSRPCLQDLCRRIGKAALFMRRSLAVVPRTLMTWLWDFDHHGFAIRNMPLWMPFLICVNQLPFVPLNVFTSQSWKLPLCVHILSKTGAEVLGTADAGREVLQPVFSHSCRS